MSPVSDELMQLFASHTFSTYSTYAIVRKRQCQASLQTFFGVATQDFQKQACGIRGKAVK